MNTRDQRHFTTDLDTAALPTVVDRATWQAELDTLRVREKAHTREGDVIAPARDRPRHLCRNSQPAGVATSASYAVRVGAATLFLAGGLGPSNECSLTWCPLADSATEPIAKPIWPTIWHRLPSLSYELVHQLLNNRTVLLDNVCSPTSSPNAA